MLPQIISLALPLLSLATPIVQRADSTDLSLAPAKVLLDDFLANTGLQYSDQFVAVSRPLANKNNFLGVDDSIANSVEATATGTGEKEVSVAFERCRGSDVSEVKIEPCEGGTGDSGSPCIFTDKHNYTISITYTSSFDVTQPRASLTSFDGDQGTAYSGQSFGACQYTPCPIEANEEQEYVYYFRTLSAPDFDRLVFNATNGVTGRSFMCVTIPVEFAPAN